MATNSRRLSILTTQEIDDLFGLPSFTENDRRFFFDLNQAERDLVSSVYTISVAVHLILQLGYFKAKRQFFIYARGVVLADLEYIRRRYYPERDIAEIKMLSKPTRLDPNTPPNSPNIPIEKRGNFWVFIPRAEPMNYEQLKPMYEAQRSA